VMVRGTFANVRLRNKLAPGTEGGYTTCHLDGKVTTIFDASQRYMAEGALKIARERLKASLRSSDGARIKASEFRDALGVGRRLAIEILEYFDRERITLRQGDYRTLRESRAGE